MGHSTLSHEHLLCDALKWAHWSVKFLGYSVLSVSQVRRGHQERTFVLANWSSSARWYPIMHLAVLLALMVYYRVNHDELQQFTPSNGSTEYVVFTLIIALSSYAGTVYRILANIHAQSMLNFWKSTVALFDFMATRGIDFQPYSPEFQEYKRWSRNRFMLYVSCGMGSAALIGCVHPAVAYFAGWKYFKSSTPPPFLMCMYLSYSAMLGGASLAQVIWITSFLHLYRICTKILRKDLHHNADRRILDSLAVYYKIESHVEAFTEFFGWRITIEVLIQATKIVMSVFILIISLTPEPQRIFLSSFIVILTLLLGLSFYDLSNSSTLLVEEAHRLSTVLEALTLETKKEEESLRQKMQAMIAKIIGKPPQPAPGHFFTLNRGILIPLGFAITTYLIVLVQFRSADYKPETIPFARGIVDNYAST